MLGGYELRYLAAVADGEDYPVAARTIPPVVRSFATRSARKRVSEVMLASSHADDVPHVHRVTYVRLIGREPPNHDDKAAVARAFSEHRSRSREARAPLVLAGSLMLLVGVAIGMGAAWKIATRRTPTVVLPSSTVEVPLPTTTAEVAPTDEVRHPIDPVLRDALSAWVVALDQASAGRPADPPGDVASRHAAVLTALASAHADVEIVDAMRGLLDVSESFSAEASADGDERITGALVALDDAFARHGAPFYVDAVLTESVRADRRRVLASSFSVRQRRVFRSGERRITSLDLERIDDLNFERSLLGYTRPDVRYALVLTARVESYLVQQVLPSIHSADESVIVRDYADERDIEWVTTFETAVHEVLREDASASGQRDAIIALAAAMARRRHAIESMTNELHEHGWRIPALETYRWDLVQAASTLELAEAATRREVRDAQASLDAPGLAATYRALEEIELHSIALHEVQHRIDYEDDRRFAVPDALAAYTGRTESEDRVNRLAERSNAELSAYLSQVAREPARARSHLVQISTFVMNPDGWGRPECYAALVIFELLARELGVTHGPLIVRRRVQRAEIARIFLAARAHTGVEVAAAASAAWRGLYGVDLPPLEPENDLER